ncbi:hypothetical protein THAOC_28030 [Thalassiosira oceanica]|uniref:Uncharacterized protein n=1 Tax=Thalassiosira oceanica TaxID=159749 RepID=K0RHG8_THAOC|nr:hypothetical protein THAOC_28030 [Thalassiosira oceanica]|eukprot:EJK52670.1 hypothetical protein THAOC_28030 [Thalassiosira oceanica]
MTSHEQIVLDFCTLVTSSRRAETIRALKSASPTPTPCGRGGMLYAKEVDVEDCALRESCVLFITPRGEPQWSGSRGKLRDRFDDENKMEAVQAEEDCDCTGGNPSRKLAAVGYKSINGRRAPLLSTTPRQQVDFHPPSSICNYFGAATRHARQPAYDHYCGRGRLPAAGGGPAKKPLTCCCHATRTTRHATRRPGLSLYYAGRNGRKLQVELQIRPPLCSGQHGEDANPQIYTAFYVNSIRKKSPAPWWSARRQSLPGEGVRSEVVSWLRFTAPAPEQNNLKETRGIRVGQTDQHNNPDNNAAMLLWRRLRCSRRPARNNAQVSFVSRARQHSARALLGSSCTPRRRARQEAKLGQYAKRRHTGIRRSPVVGMGRARG